MRFSVEPKDAPDPVDANAVIERCAEVADKWATDEQRKFGDGGPAAAIRALKGEAK